MRVSLIYICLLSLMLGSCNKLYWYRTKVPFGSSKSLKKIHLSIVNQSPLVLSGGFEKDVRAYCLKRLAKQGFIEAKAGKYDYDFVLTMDIDSFEASQAVWLGPLGDGIPLQTHIMQLSFYYDLLLPGTRYARWNSKSAIYFFANEKRDLRRSKSVIKYAIRTID